jgi:uncharacterized small protein (DUF1192 family)
MNLKPILLDAMTALGVTPNELETLKARMLFSVSSHEAQIAALNAQIDTLTAQRNEAQSALAAARLTAAKLIATQE